MDSVASAADLPDDIAQLKSLLLRERAALQQERQAHSETATHYKQQIHSLLEALRLEKHRRYGASSEKSAYQSELFDEADTTAAEPDTAADTEHTPVSSYRRRKAAARQPLPDDLPRVRTVIELSEQERQCSCGCTLAEIGEVVSEQLDIVPAQVQVLQTVRKKYACQGCEDTIKTAPKPNVLLPKAIASANTMAYVITSKYADGIPLHRQSAILARYRIDLSR
jgi:transposase